MRIAVTSLSFHPDHTGISIYSSNFAKYLAQNGHEVTAVTGFPFYPNWAKRPEDRKKLFRTDFHTGYKILRGYLYVPRKVNTIGRMIQELTLILFSFINLFRVKKPDLIVAFTAPVTLGCLAVFIAKIRGCKCVINVQDFQVEAARSLNMLKGSLILRIIEAMEKWSYQNATLVTSISPGMVNILKENKHSQASNVGYWPNWITHVDNEEEATKSFRNEHGFSREKLLIGYAGNIGLKQGLDNLLHLAKEKRNDERFEFAIIGEGADLSRLKEQAVKLNLTNLRFIPLLSPAEYITFLKETDVVYISQRKVETDIYFPSKMLNIIAQRSTVLVNADPSSELYQFIEQQQIGYAIPYESRKELVDCLDRIDQDLKKENTQLYDRFIEEFSEQNVLNKVIQQISD